MTGSLVAVKNVRGCYVRKTNLFASFKVINVTKIQGPIGPPGYNGTQGPPGSGNLALCSYNTGTSTGQSPSIYASETVLRTESVVGIRSKDRRANAIGWSKQRKIIVGYKMA